MERNVRDEPTGSCGRGVRRQEEEDAARELVLAPFATWPLPAAVAGASSLVPMMLALARLGTWLRGRPPPGECDQLCEIPARKNARCEGPGNAGLRSTRLASSEVRCRCIALMKRGRGVGGIGPIPIVSLRESFIRGACPLGNGPRFHQWRLYSTEDAKGIGLSRMSGSSRLPARSETVTAESDPVVGTNGPRNSRRIAS